jgi:hypothetical protein
MELGILSAHKKGGQDARPTKIVGYFLFESHFVLKATIAYRKLRGFKRTLG